MSTYAWGAYGQQGAERQEREQALAKQAQQRAQELAEWQSRVPAWQDGVRQMDALLVQARAQVVAARDASARAFAALEAACYVRQRGECAYSAEGQPLLDNNHPAVARENDAWLEAQEGERRASARVHKLEAERAYYAGLIATARSMR
jgi:hypothetical protein